MEIRRDLPYDDRSPTDGELFSIEDLYLAQPRYVVAEHFHTLVSILKQEKVRIEEIDAAIQTGEQIEGMSDEEMRNEIRRAQDRIIRTLGAISISLTPPIQLHARIVRRPPTSGW